MPAILKSAVVEAYRSCGWDVANSIWLPYLSANKKYPTFSDVLKVLPQIIDSSDFSQEVKGNYKGALVMRVASMTVGIPGVIFGDERGICAEDLFEKNTVIDLSDLGSEETIALIMGVIIMQLNEYRQSERKKEKNASNMELRHVTVLEEAHNLLKRTNTSQSQDSANIVGKSVEMISNSIKELRTYGEGFVIIDQSPMAVDETAIENTSTKMVFNIPGKDACEAMSSALSLNDEQTRELSRLNTGVAVVFQKGWLNPVLMKVDMWDSRYSCSIRSDDSARIRKLNGDLITCLVKNSEDADNTLHEMKRLIEHSEIYSERKADYLSIVYELEETIRLKKAWSVVHVGNAILRISNIQGLLDVLYRTDARDVNYVKKHITPEWEVSSAFQEIQEEYILWFLQILEGFSYYADIDDKMIIVVAVLNMLIALGKQDKTGRYMLFTAWRDTMYEYGKAWSTGEHKN